jgi:alcohol dehydrogenase class IV
MIGESDMEYARSTWGFSICNELIFGRGALAGLGKVAAKLGGKRVLLITDPGVRAGGHVDSAAASLEESGLSYEIYDRGEPEPTIGRVQDCTAVAGRDRYDLFVCLGGGSVIDLGKAAAVLVRYGGHPQDYFGEGKVPGPIAPLIAVPTTAGTGSEISPTAVLTDEQANLKKGIADNKLRPAVGLVDPLLTLSCPSFVTAATGIDVLAHAIESFMAISFRYLPLKPEEKDTVLYHGATPLTSCLAERGIRLVAENLRTAVHQGQNVEARDNMAMANVITSLAYTNSGVTAVHAMAYPLGAVSHASHGVVNGLLLPHVMEYNLPLCTSKLATIAGLMGAATVGMSERDAALSAVAAVHQLLDEIGLPRRMREIGVKETDIRPMAEATMGVTRILRGNPRTPTADDLEEIYRRAF